MFILNNILKSVLCLLLSISLLYANNNFYFYYSYSNFDFPQRSPFTEIYISIPAKNIVYYSSEKDQFQAGANILITVYQNDTVYYVDKYQLLSPPFMDSSFKNLNIVDLRRIMLPEGSYKIEISVEDLNDPDKYAIIKDTIALTVTDHNFPVISDVQLGDTVYKTPESVENSRFSKYGYEIIPNVTGKYALNELFFYFEVYHTHLLNDEDIFLKTYIYDEKQENISNLFVYKRDAAEVVPVFGSTTISELNNGVYTLHIDLINLDETVLTTASVDFYISDFNVPEIESGFIDTFSNSINYTDILTFLEYLFPIANQNEKILINSFVNDGSIHDSMNAKLFFFNFWLNRDKKNPLSAWNTYFERVKIANYHFTSQTTNGFLSDRGYVFLKYGKPNEIIPHIDEPEAYPYEIWRYNRIQGYSNIKFVFYNPTQLQNEFELLHSNMRGEVMNTRWKTYIYARSRQIFDPDRNTSPNNHGSQLDRLSSP